MRDPGIDINMDVGESFGRWRLGDDAGAMPWITSANIACGFHAGDPGIMRATARSAIEHDVAIGAHVGFPDLLGFGRRRIDVSAEEVRDYTAYQVGALDAIVRSEGGRLAHVKPHGALYALCSHSAEHAAGVAEAIAGSHPGLPLLLGAGDVAPALAEHGIPLVLEAFPDLAYAPDGALEIEPVKQAWDPRRVAERAVRLVREHRIDTNGGPDLELHPATLCLHGDAPNAAEVARTVRGALTDAGVTVRTIAAPATGPPRPA